MKIKRPAWLTKTGIAVIAAVAALSFGFSTVAGASPPVSSSSGTGNATSGQQLFAQNCAVCHGSNLQGGTGPPLNPLTFGTLDYAFLTDHICNGFTQSVDGYTASLMPHWCQNGLSTQDILDLAAFVIYENQHVHAQKGITANTLRLDLLSNSEWSLVGIGIFLIFVAVLASINMRWIGSRSRRRR